MNNMIFKRKLWICANYWIMSNLWLKANRLTSVKLLDGNQPCFREGIRNEDNLGNHSMLQEEYMRLYVNLIHFFCSPSQVCSLIFKNV